MRNLSLARLEKEQLFNQKMRVISGGYGTCICAGPLWILPLMATTPLSDKSMKTYQKQYWGASLGADRQIGKIICIGNRGFRIGIPDGNISASLCGAHWNAEIRQNGSKFIQALIGLCC